jgi:hypothetical protein
MDIKIGIVLNYKNAEKKKDELYCLNSEKWLKFDKTHQPFSIMRKNKKCIPADVAIGVYLESFKDPEVNIIIDYITPDDISVARFKENDIVFIIIYDLLEAFHLSDKSKFDNFKNTLKNSPNVYPPYSYQKFINNKCTYYKYLANKKIPVAPTYCITKEKWLKRDSENYVNKVLSKVRHNKWKSIIAKPVYGQESKDFAKFKEINESVAQKNHLTRYLSKNIPKYKSIIIQEYIPGFDKDNPEIRTYFIDGIYAYSVVTTSTLVETPVQEGGNFKIPTANWEYLMKFSQHVMDSLPKLNLPGLHRNPILTRIDIGSGLKNAPFSYFINEIEFVPSLYIEDQDFPVVEEIAKSLLEVAFLYYTRPLPIKVKF